MNENEKARYDAIKEDIDKCIQKDFVVPKNIPIPFEGSVLIKEYEVKEVILASGLYIGGAETQVGRNIVKPNVGIVAAVGPKVPDYIKVGLRVYFNQNIDLEYFIGGQYYKMSYYNDIYAAITDDTLISMDTKDEKEITRENLVARDENYQKNTLLKDANDKDHQEWLRKLQDKGLKHHTIIKKGDA